MPPEWDTHSGTLLSWPVNPDTWPGGKLAKVEKVYTDIIRALAEFENIHLIVHDHATYQRAKASIRGDFFSDHAVTYHFCPSNDVWTRDFGPIYIKKETGEVAITNWDYNAWGEKYPPYDSDNKIPEYFAEKFNIKSFKPGMVLEGGSIETNGAGVMLTTESVLLNPNRNPDYSKDDIEGYLKSYLGQDHFIWLKAGLAGDDTDGHIDDLARFVSENTIVAAVSDQLDDINYEVLQQNYEILKSAKNAKGNNFEVIFVPMPLCKVDEPTVDGSEYVPASYTNFYIANHVVLLPLYDERFDDTMIQLFKRLFPDRKVIGIPCSDLVWGQGSIHCITQQMY